MTSFLQRFRQHGTPALPMQRSAEEQLDPRWVRIAERIHVPNRFNSPLHNYVRRLGTVYNPVEVQSLSEFRHQLTSLATTQPIAVKTLILPPGVTLSDPRLPTARIVAGRTYNLPVGEQFIMPRAPVIADVDKSLEVVAPYATPDFETRHQVIPDDVLFGTLPSTAEQPMAYV